MKAADRAAIKRVRNAATSAFAQHIFFLQNSDRKRWDHLWRSVRLRCPDCKGYLRPNTARGTHLEAQCVECGTNAMTKPDFWKEKAKIVAHLFAEEDHGALWPYFLIEPRPLRVPA